MYRIAQVVGFGARIALTFFSIPADWVPAAVVGLAFADQQENQRVTEQRSATTLVESRIAKARSAFAPAFHDFAWAESDRMLDKLEVRYASRMESLEKSLAQLDDLSARAAAAAEAARRLESLEPLHRRQAGWRPPSLGAYRLGPKRRTGLGRVTVTVTLSWPRRRRPYSADSRT